MDEVYTKIQVYLMKKDKECDTLRFLTSKTTPSNAAHINDVCNSMKTILQTSTVTKNNPRDFATTAESIQHFKFLLLNTNFRSQEYLCEDIANGHLVDMCPSLSPYLLIQIIWALNYDEILCNSILYIPMDLCTEILDILRRCLDVDFQRAFNVILEVIRNCYQKLIQMIHQDTQILDAQKTLKQFLGSVQELLTLIPSLQLKATETLSQLLKYETFGWVLMKILNTMRDCVALRRTIDIPPILDKELVKLYQVNFGRNFMVQLDATEITESIDELSKEFVDTLLANVKKIDCFVYMGWAEIDYVEDTSMTMQRAVGLACYHFIEYLGPYKENEMFVHIVECLQQLSSKPDAPFSMSLRELCTEVEKGNKKCLRKLIQRFEEWNSSAVSCLDINRSIIEKDECLTLLNSGVKFLTIPDHDDLATEVYCLVMKTLLGQKIVDIIEIVVEFIVTLNACGALESTNFDRDFKDHVNQGEALCSSKTSLRIILFFIVQNPRKGLKMLIEVCIGYPEYSNSVMLAEDFCKLSPILKIRDFNNRLLLTNALKEVCSENKLWNSKKFVDLIRILSNRNIISADNLLEDVFVPVLKSDIVFTNVQSILTCIRLVKVDLTPKFKKNELLCILATRIMSLRKNTKLSIYTRDEMLSLLIRIVQLFAEEKRNSAVNNEADSSLAEILEFGLEPLDKIYFAPYSGWMKNDTGLNNVLQDYDKRCLYVMNELKDTRNGYIGARFLAAHGLQIFLQHIILRSTEFEYLKFAEEALWIHWNQFGWRNELEAYAQFSLDTIKVCNSLLDPIHPSDSLEFTSQKFSSLLKNLSKLTICFISIDIMTDYESVYRSLVAAINALDSTGSEVFKTCLNESTVTVYSYDAVVELVKKFDEFAKRCDYQPVADDTVRLESAKCHNFNLRFISMCLNWPMGKHNLMLSKIDKKLYSKC